jgi:hypothetical protein
MGTGRLCCQPHPANDLYLLYLFCKQANINKKFNKNTFHFNTLLICHVYNEANEANEAVKQDRSSLRQKKELCVR